MSVMALQLSPCPKIVPLNITFKIYVFFSVEKEKGILYLVPLRVIVSYYLNHELHFYFAQDLQSR